MHDSIRMALEAHGLETKDHYLFDNPNSPYVGPQFCIRTCEMIYSLAEPDLLLIVLYRRFEKSGSIKNPFADLLWFLELATRVEFGLRRVMGYINTFNYGDEGGLSDQRLTAFYQRFFQAERIRYDGNLWLFKDVEPLRARLAQVRHKATRF